MMRKTVWALGLVAMFCGAGAVEAQAPARTVALNISARPLGDALAEFGKQADLTIVFLGTDLKQGLTSQALTGKFSAEAALTKLLEGTGLRYEYLDPRTVAIRGRKGERTSTGGDPADQMRVGPIGEPQRLAQATATRTDESGNQVTVTSQRDRPVPFQNGNLDLTRTEDDVLHYTVFDARDIALSGSMDVAEFLRNRLAQNFGDDNAVLLDTVGGQEMNSNRNGVDMRGWGAAETIFLLNGRRMAPQFSVYATDVSNLTPELRGIPLASIERIEILNGAGSAIYGAGATGGVVNIITRRDYSGGQVSVNYETPADVLAASRGVNFNYGLPLKWGVGLRLSGSYADTEPVYAEDRQEQTILRWRRLAMERDPTRLISVTNNNSLLTGSRPMGATPNIRAMPIPASPGILANPTPNLFANRPGSPASNYTTVPDGYTGGGGLAAFTPGRYNIGMAEGSAGSSLIGTRSRLGRPTSTTTFGVGLDKNFGDNWRWSLDGGYVKPDSDLSYNLGGTRNFATASATATGPRVPAAAPSNPFDVDVAVSLLDPRLEVPGLTAAVDNETWDASTTLQGTIGGWRGFFDVGYSKNENSQFTQSYVEPIGGWNAAFLSNAYNPFVDMRVAAPAAPSFYDNFIVQDSYVASASESWTSSLKASGAIATLPAGEVALTGGLSWSRTERVSAASTLEYRNFVTGALQAPVGGALGALPPGPNTRFTLQSRAVYAEATVPVFSAEQDIPMVERLELFGSYRVDGIRNEGFSAAAVPVHYTKTTNLYAAGFRYDIVEGVGFRVSQTGGFRPPAISQVTPGNPPTTDTTGLNDPRRLSSNGQPESLTLLRTMYITGGNSDLVPESTDAFNAGVILKPRWLPGFRMSIDYTREERGDAIFSLGAQEAINLELEIPGIVQRGAPDGHASGLGPITFVDRRFINLREIASKSLDISIDQEVDNVGSGRLVLSALASKNLSFKVQTSNTGAPVEQVRNPASTLISRQIKWNGNAQLRWESPVWGIGWSTRYYDSLLVNPATAGIVLLQGGPGAPWKLTHDLNLSYRAPAGGGARGMSGLMSGTSLTFGIKNVFDRAPRFWAPATDSGIAPFDGVLMGRSVWMRLSKDFT